VRLPGRETRLSEAPYTQFDDLLAALTRELRPWLDIPYAVFGHSMGSLLAFEWVRQLQSEAESMPEWLFLSGRRAPDAAVDSAPLRNLPDEAFVQALTRRYEGIPQELLQDPELLAVFLPTLRADISVVESYRYREGDVLECPVTVSAGIGDSSVSYEQLLGWKRQTRGVFAAHLYPGGHFYPQSQLLKAIAATLAGKPAASQT
jgi:surfactin synthase thioesterase subunit